MGLISTEVEVGLASRNILYYENLGYTIPRIKSSKGMIVPHGTKIVVNIKDLPISSHTKVWASCDYCGRKIELTYKNYNNHNHNGKTYCQYCHSKIFNSGENSYNWNPNKTNEERINERRYPEYLLFVKSVLARDNYTCQCCGVHNNSMEVHHLDGYDNYKDKRTDVSNGITLCSNCHSNFHQKYGRGNNEKWQYIEWIGVAKLKLKKYNGKLPTSRQIYDIEEDKIYSGALEYSKIHKVDTTNVYNCCNHKTVIQKYVRQDGNITPISITKYTVCGHHILWYDEYLEMTKEELEQFLQKSENKSLIKVICITTGKIFNSISEASRYYNANMVTISLCCRGKRKTSGQLNGVPLKWMYLSDFNNLLKEEQDKLLNVEGR